MVPGSNASPATAILSGLTTRLEILPFSFEEVLRTSPQPESVGIHSKKCCALLLFLEVLTHLSDHHDRQ